MEWHQWVLWVWDVHWGRKTQLFLAVTALENKSARVYGDDTHQTARKWRVTPSTYARLMNFLPHFVPAGLTFLGELSCSQVSSLRSHEARDRQSRPSSAEHVQRSDLALTSLTATRFPALWRALHCSCYVIHHGCHNPICTNITNKAGVPG